jgi:hypothetical protein
MEAFTIDPTSIYSSPVSPSSSLILYVFYLQCALLTPGRSPCAPIWSRSRRMAMGKTACSQGAADVAVRTVELLGVDDAQGDGLDTTSDLELQWDDP